MTEPVNLRASSISSCIDCPKRGLSIQLGLVDQLPSTVPAVIGSACHEGTAVFDQAVLDGNPIKPNDAAEVVVDYLQDPGQEVNWGRSDPREIERRALGVFTRYCSDIAPEMTYKAVELPLDSLIIDVEGVEIELTGTLDRVYEEWTPIDDNSEILTGRGILDIKTGAAVCSTKPGKHKAQIAVYELLSEATTDLPVTLPGLIAQLQTSKEYQVAVKRIDNAKQALIGDEYQAGLLQHIARMIKSGDFYGNSSSWLCSNQYCPLYEGCIFK